MIPVQIDKIAYETHKASGTLERYRDSLIERLMYLKYTPGAEIALLIDKDKKPEKFAKHEAYREECKALVDGWFEEMN